MKKLFFIISILISGVVYSQEMKVHKTDGSISSFQLEQIDSITFTSYNQSDTGTIFFSKGSLTDRDIYKINPNGTGLIPIIQWSGSDERIPRISPDKTKMAFISNKSGIFQVWVSDINGSNAYQLTNSAVGTHWDLSWHPNSQTIFFDEATASTDARVCKINLDGTGFEVLIDHIGSCEYDILGQINPINTEYIIYQHDHCWGPYANVYKYNFATQTEDLILDGSLYNTPHGCYRWSPDGSKILFMLGKDGLCESFDLYIMNSDGSNKHSITSVIGSDGFYNPSWSPDGSKIVSNYFTNYCDDPHYLFIMNSDGTNSHQIYYNANELVCYPEWVVLP